MDGIHDMGGKQGFGTVRFEAGKTIFHDAWEKRINALTTLIGRRGLFNMDEYRHAIERMDPRHYLSAGYYERVMTALATICVEKGVLSLDELESQAHGAFPLARAATPGRKNATPAKSFKVGDRVRVKNEFVSGHVRMPAYIRGKTGIVVGVTPAYPFPDAHGHGLKADDEPTYDVRFQAADLWPQSADDASVHVGVFQSYLEEAV
jgi:nitrile hydratase beta subunit